MLKQNNVTRKEDWANRFIAFVKNAHREPFKWGKNDCALFVCNAVFEITGYDLAEDFRGLYKTKKEAYKILKEKGSKSLYELALDRGGAPYENINFAKRGDVVLLKCGKDISLGIIDMSGRVAITTGKEGLQYYKQDKWLKAWEI